MQIMTRAKGFALTDALHHHVKQRLHFAFDRIGARVRRVVVRLSDVNGPRGGADKRCQLQVQLDQSPDVVIQDTQGDLYVAVDRATERAASTVARRLSRKRAHPREGLPKEQAVMVDPALNGLENKHQ